MRKLGRGTTFEVTTDVPGCNIGIVKWFDNKAVNLGSNFIASGEVDRVTRWDKKEKQLIDIERTEIVNVYCWLRVVPFTAFKDMLMKKIISHSGLYFENQGPIKIMTTKWS